MCCYWLNINQEVLGSRVSEVSFKNKMADPVGYLNLHVDENHSSTSYEGLRLLHALLCIIINKSVYMTKHNKF